MVASKNRCPLPAVHGGMSTGWGILMGGMGIMGIMAKLAA
jgi:hypothetical protein